MSHTILRPQSPGPDLWVCHLGLVPYATALAAQESLRSRRQAGEIPDTLLLLEHPPVYTLGRRAAQEDLLLGAEHHRRLGIEVVPVDRGGKITYHGPGQLVGYPIMAIGDVLRHVRLMERAIVGALAQEGVQARARTQDGADFTGVWVAERKIASIGVHVRRGVSTHGFAVNVENDLEPFTRVIACGLPGVLMTSLALESHGAGEGLRCFRKRVAHSFCQAHGRRQRIVSAVRLGIDAADPTRLASERAPLIPVVAPGEPVPA